MRNAIILHGISSTPNDFWFPAVKRELEKINYAVWVPQLPQADHPDITVHVPWILKNGTIDTDTILIGHSSGASLILALLDAIDIQIPQAILVAGFLIWEKPRPKEAVKAESEYHWPKMKNNVKQITFINSTNDPWGCNDTQGRLMFDHFGGLLIINNDGHMGSTYFKQPYKQFPLLIKLIELAENK